MSLKDLRQLSKIFNDNKALFKEKKSNTTKQKDKSLDDVELFLKEMEGVKPLKAHGREVVPNKKKKFKDFFVSEETQLEKALKGEIEFEVEFTTEYMQGNVKGLDPRILNKLKCGHYSPEAYIDLHGFILEDAWDQLVNFIRDCYLKGKRCVLIVTGRGKNSPLGKSILRESLQMWLTRDPFKRVVLAFTTAQPRHGGTGAVYVLLRKYKKTKGKIYWDKYFIHQEP